MNLLILVSLWLNNICHKQTKCYSTENFSLFGTKQGRSTVEQRQYVPLPSRLACSGINKKNSTSSHMAIEALSPIRVYKTKSKFYRHGSSSWPWRDLSRWHIVAHSAPPPTAIAWNLATAQHNQEHRQLSFTSRLKSFDKNLRFLVMSNLMTYT